MLSSGALIRFGLVFMLVASVVLTQVGLFDQMGYDLSIAIGVIVGLLLPPIAAARVAEVRRSSDARRRTPLSYALSLFAQVAGAGIAFVLIPVLVLLIRGIWVPHCDLSGGLMWFALHPVVTVMYVAALSIFFALATRSPVLAAMASYGFLALTVGLAVRQLAAEPPVFVFNGLVGYFAGPIYDERVEVTRAVMWARAGTLFLASLFVALVAATVNVRNGRLEPVQFLVIDFSFENVAPRLAVIGCVVALGVLHLTRHTIGTSQDAGSIRAALGERTESEHFVIYFDGDGLDSIDVALLGEDHEFRLAEILHDLELDALPTGEKIESYVYPDPDVKKRLMGARHTQFADPLDRAIHLNWAPFPHPSLKHELVHAVSASYAGPLGFNMRIGIHEGLAEALDWEEERLTPHEWSAIMKRENLLPDMVPLMTSMAFWRQPPGRAYLAAGSFVRHLLDVHGAAPVLAFFRDSEYEKHFGRPIGELLDEWNRSLDEITVSGEDVAFAMQRLRPGAIFDRRCPRQAAVEAEGAWAHVRAGRTAAALEAFERVLAWSPGDAGARRGKLTCLIELGRTDAARALARSFLTSDDDGSVAAHAHDILGNLAWEAGDVDEARTAFEAVRTGGGPESLRRLAEAKLATLRHDDYRNLLTGSADETESVTLLTRLAVWGPERGLANYLLGRRLYGERAWSASAERLREAARAVLHGERLEVECLELLGQASYRLADMEGADLAFREIAGRAPESADARLARSWINRTRWRRDLAFEAVPRESAAEEVPAIASGSAQEETVPSDAPSERIAEAKPAPGASPASGSPN